MKCRDCPDEAEPDGIRCMPCRQKHGQMLIDQLNKILDEACKCCVNHWSCYKQNKDGSLRKNHRKCSRKTFDEKMMLIGQLHRYHPVVNPKGWGKDKRRAEP